MARLSISRKRIIVGSVLLLVIAALVAVNIMRSQNGSWFATGPVIEVEAREISKGSISATVVASGVAELARENEVYLESGIKVNEVLVEQFDQVSAGQQILDLDLDSLYLQLEKEQISLEIQELSYTQSAGPGDAQSLGDLESARLLAENEVRSARLALDSADANLNRIESLYRSGAASRVELEDAQKQKEDAAIAYDNACVRLANAVNAQETGTSIQSANVQASQVRVEELENQISKAEASQYAPAAGIVTAVNIKDGEISQSVEPGIVISDFSSLQVRANVNEADKNTVEPGQEVIITSDAFANDARITGTVESVALLAKTYESTTTGKEKVFETIVAIEDAMSYMRILSPGQNVDCEISTRSADDALICSYDMIMQEKDGQKYVFVVNVAEQKVRKQNVSLGIISELDAEVTEGLSEGDVLVLNPPPNLKDGSSIKIVDSVSSSQE